MSWYICSNCGVDFGYQQGIDIHKELGCEWGEDDDESMKYCCGMIYEEGEVSCASCGESL